MTKKLIIKTLTVTALLSFAAGSYVANETNARSERPLLRVISWAARWGLRGLVFLEPAPPELEQQYQNHIGADGFETINHRQSL